MTDWESCYLDGNTPWDKGEASPPLSAWVMKHTLQGRALVPGCGVGHDVALLVDHGLDALGVDLSRTAVEKARETHAALADHFIQGDLFALPAEWSGTFDYVFEHTCLCALPPELRQSYQKAVTELLKPGGRLVGVWFINPDMEPGEEGPPFGISLEDLEALFPASDWAVEEDYIPEEAYDGRVGRERLRVLCKRS
ncbi:MAG: TPMT family class I SAM-dependent methyltransferase [Prosthecobacter sp.]|nr:TPMT family class I SAM-dependent methyltransferase [Prosthecobacter sp.]